MRVRISFAMNLQMFITPAIVFMVQSADVDWSDDRPRARLICKRGWPFEGLALAQRVQVRTQTPSC